MAAITSIIAGASLALGTAGQVANLNQKKRDEREQKKALERQRVEAAEAAALRGPQQEDARVRIGADDDDETRSGTQSSRGTANRKSKPSVGGFYTSASSVGGL